MKHIALIFAALLVSHSGLTFAAEFALVPTLEAATLPQDKLAISGAIFQELHKRSGGTLIDGTDAQLKSRLVLPGKYQPVQFEVKSSVLYRLKKSLPVVTLIVEPTGQVLWATVLEPSGDAEIDAIVLSIVTKMKFGTPATLDGQPIRVYLTSDFLIRIQTTESTPRYSEGTR